MGVGGWVVRTRWWGGWGVAGWALGRVLLGGGSG